MYSDLYSKIKKNYKDGGITRVIKTGKNKIAHSLYNSNNAFWFRLDLRNELTEVPCNEHITVHMNCPDETIQYIKEYGYYYPKEIDIGLSSRHIYSNIKYEGSIIGYNKTGFSHVYIEDFKREYTFIKNVAFTYDTFIDSKYRNNRYGTYLLFQVCSLLKQEGYKSIWAHIPPWNKSSERMHHRLGFQRYKKINYYSVAGISWTTSNPLLLIKSVEDYFETGDKY